MPSRCDLRILFPTSYSDACFQTGRALAQLADRNRVNITIVHVVRPGRATGAARRELDSFLAEADHDDRHERILLEAKNAAVAVADLARTQPFDLLMAPAADRLGLHSVLMPSFRAHLLRRVPVPLWTSGPHVDYARLQGRLRHVACLVDDVATPGTESMLRLAASFAARFDAQLHMLSVVPAVTEGTVLAALDDDHPLTPDDAVERAEARFGVLGVRAHAAYDSGIRTVGKLLGRCEADLLFVGQGHALCGVMRPKVTRMLNRLPCPVVVLGEPASAFSAWSFERASRSEPHLGDVALVPAT